MPKFDISQYETVEERLKKFWADYPNGRIWTEEVFVSDDAKTVIFKAFVYIDKEDINPVSTGIAEETKGQGNTYVNSTSHVENCETSAIGRALANWNYQGTGKKRPSREEMSKVDKQPATKKEIVQETTTLPSKITATAVKSLVLSMCNDDKNFAKKCYETSMTRLTMDKSISTDVSEWSNETVDKFMLLVESYVTKFKQEFENRAGNSEVVNNIIETLGSVEEKESEEDMDFSNDDWKAGKEADPMTDAQKGFLETLITQCIDNGKDELASEAKQYLNSDNTSKVTCSDMISKLKNALS